VIRNRQLSVAEGLNLAELFADMKKGKGIGTLQEKVRTAHMLREGIHLEEALLLEFEAELVLMVVARMKEDGLVEMIVRTVELELELVAAEMTSIVETSAAKVEILSVDFH
jgi:hypothetical protein